jgi:hypothetical protein
MASIAAATVGNTCRYWSRAVTANSRVSAAGTPTPSSASSARPELVGRDQHCDSRGVHECALRQIYDQRPHAGPERDRDLLPDRAVLA